MKSNCHHVIKRVDLHVASSSLLCAFGLYLEQRSRTTCLLWSGGLSDVLFEEILDRYPVLVTLSRSLLFKATQVVGADGNG
jgi:hypothetical protein